MEQRNRIYAAIDLKSFYASVECIERHLDPLITNLVVADNSRTEKTICLAVSPALKAFKIPGRARLFEVVEKVKQANALRLQKLSTKAFTGRSYFSDELEQEATLAIDYIVAPPRMALYMEYSARIYAIYMKYVAPEDIHVYSIDEVFIDITNYLKSSKLSPYEFTKRMVQDIVNTVGITATAGLGTNLYLAKIAMDIVAKHIPADADGVRIADLDVMTYRRQLWAHQPLTDFWRVGKGYAKKLQDNGIFTMGDIARCSIQNEALLYRLFGVNAELLIDHAWGLEPCTLSEVKAYRPENQSTGAGQVLHIPYAYEQARIIVQEMTDLLVLDLVDKGLVTDQLVLTIGYDISNLTDPVIAKHYTGEVKTDHYGRKVPKHANGTTNLSRKTSSTQWIMEAVMELFDEIVHPQLLVRRVNIVANHIESEDQAARARDYGQLNLFTDAVEQEQLDQALKKEKNTASGLND